MVDTSFWKEKRILLTGHTGFKGSWLSLWLQKLGANLIGFSKSIPTKPSLYELADVERGMTSIIGDICNLNHLREVMERHKPQIIIHMAAQSLVLESYGDPVGTFTTNVIGTVNILEAIRQVPSAKVFLNVTSDKCYENKDTNKRYREDDPLGGYDPYSSSKGCSELVTSSFRNSFFNPEDFQKHNVAIASARAGNVVGGGDWAKDRLIPDIMRGIFEQTTIKIRKPNSIRPWQFVLDPLHGYLLLCERLWKYGSEYTGAWNFGPTNYEPKTVSWIVEKITNHWSSTRWELKEDNAHEAKFLQLDSSKAKNRLGWDSKVNLNLAFDWIIEWYDQYKQGNNLRKITEEQINRFTSL